MTRANEAFTVYDSARELVSHSWRYLDEFMTVGEPVRREALLSRTFVELADTLVNDFDVVELLTLVADRCVEALDVDAAGIMLLAPEGDLRVMASSSEAMRLLELFELQTEEGPCLDCYRAGQPVVNQNLATVDGRWPRFAPEALEAGFHSVHAVPLRVHDKIIGALNLFHAERGEIDEVDLTVAQAFADVASIAILQYRATLESQVLNEQLQHALNSRVVIEQAKGMVAERKNLDMEQAFSVLRAYARRHNLRLADVARDVIIGALTSSALGDGPPAKPSQ
jgi:GAF domain-containing protein